MTEPAPPGSPPPAAAGSPPSDPATADPTTAPAAPLRPAWQVALYAGLIILGVSTAIGTLVAVATGAIHRNPRWAGAQFGRAVFPFVVIITVAAYVIQRTRIKQR